MGRFKGIIALDIDGTITIEKHVLETPVKNYLTFLIQQGWLLIFITGRTFSFAKPILSSLEGEYFFAPQNGAALYVMPEERCVQKHYIPISLLSRLNVRGLLVESGKENQDICFYKPKDFTEEELQYIDFRRRISPEKWEAIEGFDQLKISEFAVGKFFASKEEAESLAKQIQGSMPLNVIVIRDPFRPGGYLAHINEGTTSKGRILEDFIAMHHIPKGGVIAAGDDYNDREMLEKSATKIVMRNAPQTLHEMADVIAPPAAEQGIIQGLEEALWKVSLE